MSSPTANWLIHSVALTDAAHLAHNNMSAFWTDPSWRLVWPPSITLPYLISQCTLRMPRNLLKDRAALRHQKAVDPVTGALLGYARWKLPGTKDGEWLDAQMKDVESEEREKIEERANGAWWELRDGAAPSDAEAQREMGRMLREREYLGTFPALDVVDWLLLAHNLLQSTRVPRRAPRQQEQGIATALVESGMRQAKTMGLPVFILAFKAGRGVYERLGFREVWRIIQDDSMYGGTGEYGVYLMVYDVETPE